MIDLAGLCPRGHTEFATPPFRRAGGLRYTDPYCGRRRIMRRNTQARRPKSSSAVISVRTCRPFRRRSRCRSIAAPRRQLPKASAQRWHFAQLGGAQNSRAPDRSVSRQPCPGRSTEPRRRGECSSCVLYKGSLRQAQRGHQQAAHGILMTKGRSPKAKSRAWQYPAQTRRRTEAARRAAATP